MTVNMGSPDRVIRGVVGIAAVVIASIVGAGSALGIVLWIVAALMLVTAAVGFCPVYRVLHIDTLGRHSTHV